MSLFEAIAAGDEDALRARSNATLRARARATPTGSRPCSTRSTTARPTSSTRFSTRTRPSTSSTPQRSDGRAASRSCSTVSPASPLPVGRRLHGAPSRRLLRAGGRGEGPARARRGAERRRPQRHHRRDAAAQRGGRRALGDREAPARGGSRPERAPTGRLHRARRRAQNGDDESAEALLAAGATLVQRELAVVGEAGDPDTDEPQRAGPVAQATIEQGAGEVTDPRRVVDPDVEARRAAADREVAVAKLRGHCPGVQALAKEVAPSRSAIRRSSACSSPRSCRSRSKVSSTEIEIRSADPSSPRGSIPFARSRSIRPAWPGSTARSSRSGSAASCRPSSRPRRRGAPRLAGRRREAHGPRTARGSAPRCRPGRR